MSVEPRRHRFPVGLVLGLLVLSQAPGTLVAQTLEGRLLDDGTGGPVPDATVTLLDARGNAAGTILSGPDGGFSLTAPVPGRYRLRAQRIGYGETTSSPVDVRAGEVVVVELRVST